MADIDINPFGEHESRPEEPTDEHIPLDPVTPHFQLSELEEGHVFCMTCKAVSLRPTHTDCHINTACES